MTADRLFEPGHYASIPKALLADPGLSPAAKVVWLGLATFYGGDSPQVWPGLAQLRTRTGLSRRAIQKGIDNLVAAGWLRKVSKGGPKGTNLYTLSPQRTKCASARNALPPAHGTIGPSARPAPEVLQGSTPLRKGRRQAMPPPSDKRTPGDYSKGF